ncbi:MAG: hypothetical protein SGILL_006164 [Bacillariaceae sp.]
MTTVSESALGGDGPPHNTKPPPSPHTPPRVPPLGTPSKLRRNVSVQDTIDNAISIQRLVEYFFVVSCHARSPEDGGEQQKQQQQMPDSVPTTPQPSRPPPVAQRKTSGNTTPRKKGGRAEIRLDEQGEDRLPLPATPTKPKLLKNATKRLFHKKRDRNESDQSSPSLPPDLQQQDTMDDESATTAPSPMPRETWRREEQKEQSRCEEAEGHQDNIHLPQATEKDLHTFEPRVTARFPPKDHSDNPFNPMLTHFCFPGGDIILPSKEYYMPSVHQFVLTNDKGRKVYGTCLTIYEEYNPPENTFWQSQDRLHPATVGDGGIEVSVNPEDTKLYIPKVLCILSIWPYVNAFREYLAQLYRLATSTNCMDAPIERYVMNLCMEIPAPPPGAFEVHLNILDSVIRFWSPPANLPIAYVALPYQVLFDCLDVDNILQLWYCLTLERKVLLVSTQHSLLTVCSEILCSLLYPMKWSHLYVPMLPRFLCPMLDAPVPYLCGVTRDNWMLAQEHVSDETIVVDLDRNHVMFGQNTEELPPVPGKKWSKLQNSMQEIAGDLFWKARGLEAEYHLFMQNKMNENDVKQALKQKGEGIWREKLQTIDHAFNLQFTPSSEQLIKETEVDQHEQSQWDRVQEAFLRFFVAVLKDYRRFLHVPDSSKLGQPEPGSLDWMEWSNKHTFDRTEFIAAQKKLYEGYLSELCATQQFDEFMTKRLYSPELPDIIFFDQSIDAKLNRSKLKIRKTETPFLQSAVAHKKLEKFIAVEPNTDDLPERGPFMYRSWPEQFKEGLFGCPRPIPKTITAEFDRQASLMKQLRVSFSSPGINEAAELMELYKSDYDSNPEGMLFTVFFFTYSAVIGLEWEEYQERQRQMESQCSEASFDLNKPEGEGLSQDAHDEQKEVLEKDPNALSDMTLNLCDGSICSGGKEAVSDAVTYIMNNSPCPNLNTQAQVAYDNLTTLAASIDPTKLSRDASLLDNDEAVAEYEEARAVMSSQLDLAFDTLRIMGNRGLVSDPDVFKSLMEACGRCGDTKRALELIEIMKRDKLVTDNDILVCFMASFAHYGAEIPIKENLITATRRTSDAYSSYLKKKLLTANGADSLADNFPQGLFGDDDDASGSDVLSESNSELSSFSESSEQQSVPSFLSYLNVKQPTSNLIKKKKKKRRRRKRRPTVVTDRVQKQLMLGESLLEFLYPDIFIDTCQDTCPSCSCAMDEDGIISGWQPLEFQDLTTRCPQCDHRFVPQFKVSTSSPTFIGSQGPGTDLYCEFLSPWVLRKELGHILDNSTNIQQILDPEWRAGTDVRATIWWNLIALFKRYKLPFAFLLQGSFENRLIAPGPQDV